MFALTAGFRQIFTFDSDDSFCSLFLEGGAAHLKKLNVAKVAL